MNPAACASPNISIEVFASGHVSGYEAADAPELERYDERFNLEAGLGGFEIWIPVKT